MNALSLLKQEHANVEELFHRFETCEPSDHEEMARIRDKVIEHLSRHAQIEEQVFYPALLERLADSEKADVLEGLEEHHLVKRTLAELERSAPSHPRFRPKMAVLIERVRHHVREEEEELFETVRGEFSVEELNELGEAMENAEMSASPRPHPLLPDQPPFNVLLGAPLALIDKGITRAREVFDDMVARGRREGTKAA